MKISKKDIDQFIPQRSPFIMIDNLIEADENRFETDFEIYPQNIFLEGDDFREFGLIENIAQTGAVGISFLNIGKSLAPRDGFMGAISKLKLYDLPKVGDKISTVVSILVKFGEMYSLKGESFVKKKRLIECELKLVGLVPEQSEHH